MIKIGLLEEVGERIPKRPLKLRALPLTDAHITPHGESSLPDPSEKEDESNEVLSVSEIILEEETQESEFPERFLTGFFPLITRSHRTKKQKIL